MPGMPRTAAPVAERRLRRGPRDAPRDGRRRYGSVGASGCGWGLLSRDGAAEAAKIGDSRRGHRTCCRRIWRERGAPWPSLASSSLGGHCDRSAVTVATPRRVRCLLEVRHLELRQPAMERRPDRGREPAAGARPCRRTAVPGPLRRSHPSAIDEPLPVLGDHEPVPGPGDGPAGRTAHVGHGDHGRDARPATLQRRITRRPARIEPQCPTLNPVCRRTAPHDRPQGLLFRPVVSCAARTHRCAPTQGLHIGTWIAWRRPFRRSPRSPSADDSARDAARGSSGEEELT